MGDLHTPDSDRESEHALFWRGTRIACCFASWSGTVEARIRSQASPFRIFFGQADTKISSSAIA